MATEHAIDPDRVAENLAAVRQRIAAAGGALDRVKIVAVTKGFGPEAPQAAKEVGLLDIGEDRTDQLQSKAAVVDGVRWHFIGKLQRRKVKEVASIVHLWQSVDRLELADEVIKRAAGAAVLIEVNISGEPQKGGCAWDDAPALVDHARRSGLDVRGLMAIGPTGPPELARPGFRRLAALARDLDLAELSIGMTADFEIAVSEGATMVRVGTALFGPRPQPAGLQR